MRMANRGGRLHLQEGDALVDVAHASGGRFEPAPQAVYPRWAEFREWASTRPVASTSFPETPADAGAPAPRPHQCFGIGLNYADHADEIGMAPPTFPAVFGKFGSCIAGPAEPLVIPNDVVDWEVELVVVLGATASNVSENDAWAHVAGLTIGQDISDRGLQFTGPAPQQFGLAKSRPGFGPLGPWLVTPDELADQDDLEISCLRNGEIVQHSRTGQLVFDVRRIVAYLSRHLTLAPGDVIFTGTPSGVGFGRDPQVFLRPGDRLTGRIEGLGELVTHVRGPEDAR